MNLLEGLGAITLGLIIAAIGFAAGLVGGEYIRAVRAILRMRYVCRRLNEPVQQIRWARACHRIVWRSPGVWHVGRLAVPTDPRKPIITYWNWRCGDRQPY
jgi:hypothetical protein